MISRTRAQRPGRDKGREELIYTFMPWSCAHRNGVWILEAYSMATGTRGTVAEIRTDCGFTAAKVAAYIVRAVNVMEKSEYLIEEMSAALEMCLECESLNWEAEHEAEIALRHARART